MSKGPLGKYGVTLHSSGGGMEGSPRTKMPAGWRVTGRTGLGLPSYYQKKGCVFHVVAAYDYWVVTLGGAWARGPLGTVRRFRTTASACVAADKLAKARVATNRVRERVIDKLSEEERS